MLSDSVLATNNTSGKSLFILYISPHRNNNFLVECKRPNNKQSIRNRKQLDSYIATTRIGIGIYFGEFIEVFYDERSDKDFALPVTS